MSIELLAFDTATNKCGRVPLPASVQQPTVAVTGTSATGNPIATITVNGTAVNVKESVTSLTASNGSLVFKNETGTTTTIPLCSLIEALQPLV